MEGYNPKKMAIVRIIEILRTRASKESPITQEEISKILYNKYGIELARKAIGDDLKLLEECDYDIERTNKGVYLASDVFEKTELRILIDSVLCSRYINKGQSEKIIDKLVTFGGKDYKSHVKHIYTLNEWQKTDNHQVFYNISRIDDAIEQGKKILIKYGRRGINKQLQKTYSQLVSPYTMLLHNQRYYLMGYNDYYKQITFLNIEKMINIEILGENITPYKEVTGENEIDYKDLSCARPYMFADEAINITLHCNVRFIDDIIDWFGFKIDIKKLNDDEVEVIVKSSPQAMVYWAMQYGDHIQVVAPDSMREMVIKKIKEVNSKYNL